MPEGRRPARASTSPPLRWATRRAPVPDGAGHTASAADPRLGRSWWIWTVAASAYFVAMLHRMSLGVAGSDAAARFDIPLGSLAVFTSLQLVLYLVMQIPAGLLADRFGPRRTLAIGLGLMSAGELLFAFATSMPAGLAGRGLVGIGDALTFLNVLRLVHAWFPGRLQTLLTALTGFAGALGQLVSTVPLELSLDRLGWVPTFLLLGGFTGVLVLAPLAVVRDRPAHLPRPTSHEPIVRTLIAAWRRPGTRHGFFVHMGTLSPFVLVAAVWGVPYMVDAQGMSRGDAAGYLLVASVAFAVCGPLTAVIVGDRAPRQRVAAVVLPALTTLSWAVLMAWPGGTVPRSVLLAALVLSGVGAGGSILAFEIARRESPPVSSGSAAALVNCGGFSAAVIGALAIGTLIGDGHGDPVHAQHAMLPILAFAIIGLAGSAWIARRPSITYGAAQAAAAAAAVEPSDSGR